MKEIHKKVQGKEYFDAMLSGQKTFECRLNDWECEAGDVLILEEVDDENMQYTGRVIRKKVGFIGKTKDFTWFSKDDVDKYGYQIISLLDE